MFRFVVPYVFSKYEEPLLLFRLSDYSSISKSSG